MPFESVCVSIQNASHIKRNVPREDCGTTAFSPHFDVFAVADGHGDSNCPHSNLRSLFACEIAIKQLHSFYRELLCPANQKCVAALSEHLETFLPELSARGSDAS